MYDLAKLKNARYYMLAMAEGVNPCTREFAPETDVIAIPSVQKQCEYVIGVLDELIEIATEKGRKKQRSRAKRKRHNIKLPAGIIELSETPINPSDLADRINTVLGEKTKKLHGAKINDFMVSEGYLDRIVINGRTRKRTNDRSGSIGLSFFRDEETGYEKILYSKQAQEFVVRNLGRFLKYR